MHEIMTSKQLGLILGVLYGVVVRIFWEIEALQHINSIVLMLLLLLVPFAIGFIQMRYAFYIEEGSGYSDMMLLPWQPVLVSVLVVSITLLESSLWFVKALPVFMVFASLGGLLVGALNRSGSKKVYSAACSAMVLPFLAIAIDVSFGELVLAY